MAPAIALAGALRRQDLDAVAALLTQEATLWAASRSLMEPSLGRREVTQTLARLTQHRLPTRIRVMRNGLASAVLSGYADDEALWSLEVAVTEEHIDCVMLWMPLPAHQTVFGLPSMGDDG